MVVAIEYVYVLLSRQTNFLFGWVRVTFWWLDCLFRETTEFISVTERKFEAISLNSGGSSIFRDNLSFRFFHVLYNISLLKMYIYAYGDGHQIIYTLVKKHIHTSTHIQSLENQ